jgi:predicted lipoprotein
MRLFILLTGLAMLLSASARADEAAAARDTAVVRAFVDGYARPSYAALTGATRALEAATARYCGTPGDAARTALGDAFRDVVVAWARVDFLRFGPATRKARLERFAFWPDPRGFVERQLRPLLSGPEGATIDLAGLAGRSAAIQGLPAFERLLMSAEGGAQDAGFPRRCHIAGLVAANLSAIADELDAAWRAPDGIVQSLTAPGPADPTYRTPAEAAGEILKAIVTGLEQTRDLAIAPALGSSPEAAKPTRFPYARSGATLAYLRASVQAVADLLVQSRFADDLPPDDAWARDSMLFELRSAMKALAALDGTPDDLARSPEARAKLDYVRIALASVRATVAGPVAQGLGLNPGFNALDGD